MKQGNIFSGLPVGGAVAESFDVLVERPGFRVERIVSAGQASPTDFWYDQPQDEWVVLLSGTAGLRFADEVAVRELKPGDWLHIPAHMKHRVEWTTSDAPTVWLAVHFDP
jgi:cupin 2 domain-containing protein